MTRVPDPWCNTCGKDISKATWNENDGECDSCKKFWDNHTKLEQKQKNNEIIDDDDYFGFYGN